MLISLFFEMPIVLGRVTHDYEGTDEAQVSANAADIVKVEYFCFDSIYLGNWRLW